MRSSLPYAALWCAGVLGLVLPDGVGKLPAMGWNSWNAYGCDIDESKFLKAAEAMVTLGFKDVGYEYVNIDDCWSNIDSRDAETGQLVTNTTKFPDGIDGLAKKVHDMGLKIGIYSSAGTHTCAGYPASIGYESIDAATWAAWGIDYLKYDNCNIPTNWTDACDSCVPGYSPSPGPNGTCTGGGLCPANYDYSTSNTAERYRIMRDALLSQNRTILYSLCNWGRADVLQWGNATGSSWRMSNDIGPRMDWIYRILNTNSFELNSVDFWGHNDADMLEVGNGLTPAQSRAHFALWAAMKSPLILGSDLETLSPADISLLKNKYLLAFHQDDVYGAPATPYKWGLNPDWTFNITNPAEFWSGNSKNGTLVLMLNTLNNPRQMAAIFDEIPGLRSSWPRTAIDIWTDEQVIISASQTNITKSVAGGDVAGLLFQW